MIWLLNSISYVDAKDSNFCIVKISIFKISTFWIVAILFAKFPQLIVFDTSIVFHIFVLLILHNLSRVFSVTVLIFLCCDYKTLNFCNCIQSLKKFQYLNFLSFGWNRLYMESHFKNFLQSLSSLSFLSPVISYESSAFP